MDWNALYQDELSDKAHHGSVVNGWGVKIGGDFNSTRNGRHATAGVVTLGTESSDYPGYMDTHSECEWNMCFWLERRFSINKNYCEWKYSWIELSIGDPPLIVNTRLRGVQALEKSRDPYKQDPLVQTGHLNQAINLQLTTWPGKNVSPPNTELFNTYDNHIIISFNPRKIQLCTCRVPSL